VGADGATTESSGRCEPDGVSSLSRCRTHRTCCVQVDWLAWFDWQVGVRLFTLEASEDLTLSEYFCSGLLSPGGSDKSWEMQ
jgi:hypothetical protein